MKKIIIFSVITLICLFLFAINFRTEYEPLNGDIIKVEIYTKSLEGKASRYVVSNKSEIEELKTECGKVHRDFIASGSNEGLPIWELSLHYSNGDMGRIYIDEDEFSGSKYNNPKFIQFLARKYG